MSNLSNIYLNPHRNQHQSCTRHTRKGGMSRTAWRDEGCGVARSSKGLLRQTSKRWSQSTGAGIMVRALVLAASCIAVETFSPSCLSFAAGTRSSVSRNAAARKSQGTRTIPLAFAGLIPASFLDASGGVVTCGRSNGGLFMRRSVARGCAPMGGFITVLRQRLRTDTNAGAGATSKESNSGDSIGKDAVGALDVYDVRLDGSRRRRVLWDEKRARFFTVSVTNSSSETEVVANEFTNERTMSGGYRVVRNPAQAWSFLSAQVSQAFVPRGVTEDYYAFTLWRMAQRIVSSTVSVFGTQALLLALGMKTNTAGVAAAAGWIWANAIGKFGKTAFAARYGSAFDSDAKRWRLRAALMWVLANGMEILTFVIQSVPVFAKGFTFFVAFSVSLKQISILTASATRGTFYKQFAGKNENLGDITAKGDAQVAVADLVGMVMGIELARLAGTQALYIWGAYICLSALDFIFICKSLDTIVFRFLNLERYSMVAHTFVRERRVMTPEEMTTREPILNRPLFALPQDALTDMRKGYWANTFRSISQTRLNPDQLRQVLQVFKGESYLLVLSPLHAKPVIVLHQGADEGSVACGLLAWEFLKRSLAASSAVPRTFDEALALTAEARQKAREMLPALLADISGAGWNMKDDLEPVLVFGYIGDRSIWPRELEGVAQPLNTTTSGSG